MHGRALLGLALLTSVAACADVAAGPASPLGSGIPASSSLGTAPLLVLTAQTAVDDAGRRIALTFADGEPRSALLAALGRVEQALLLADPQLVDAGLIEARGALDALAAAGESRVELSVIELALDRAGRAVE